MEDRRVVQIALEEDLICLRGLSPKRLRFGVEYGLERGTCHNSFLHTSSGNCAAVLVHPPGDAFAEPFLEQLKDLVPFTSPLSVVLSDVNPNRVALLQRLAKSWPQLKLMASNAGAKLLKELWNQQRPGTEAPTPPPALAPLEVVKHEQLLVLPNGHELQLLALPTPRWPGGLAAFHGASGLLMSGRFFGAHLCTESYAETNPTSSSEDRRYYYDCLMAPMANQVELVVNRLEELAIRSIAPGHGPAIVDSWRSLLADYRRWGEAQRKASLVVTLLYASAYGNTAAIADAIAQGIAKTGVRVNSLNCEFSEAPQLLAGIKNCDAVLIGSPTLGGHAPTPIVSALGTLLAEGDRSKPVGVFGSFGWSGEALDLLESKLTDAGFQQAFETIRVKFSPDPPTLKRCEETGMALARLLQQQQKRQQKRNSGGLSESRSDPAVLALGRVIGSLCVLTAQKGEGEQSLSGAMVASWVSQASFQPPGFSVAVARDRAVEALLHIGDRFALNVLAEGRELATMKQFLQPFSPGSDRFAGLELRSSPAGQPLLPEALAWLEATVQQRMDCGDHWVLYAQVTAGGLFDETALTALHHRRSGANY
ncbi:diflavin flavoprotein [Synechococcus sp. UW140]|uniref:diflavin flavoprotein n=1 Tax=Synechococcus sp. UW140 TaxID=368503 RepID=UPI003137BDF0